MAKEGLPRQVWYLKGVELFRHLPSRTRHRLEARLRALRFRRGQVIYSAGEPATSVFLVRQGAVEVAVRSPRGRKVTLAVVGPGEVFGYLGVLSRGGRPHVATALAACEILCIPSREVRRLCRFHPDFTLQVARTLEGTAIRYSAKIESLLFKPVAVRLAEALGGLAQRFGTRQDGALRLDLRMTQQSLANLIGASRQHVGAALRSLTAQGLIRRVREYIGRFEIPDITRLGPAIRPACAPIKTRAFLARVRRLPR